MEDLIELEFVDADPPNPVPVIHSLHTPAPLFPPPIWNLISDERILWHVAANDVWPISTTLPFNTVESFRDLLEMNYWFLSIMWEENFLVKIDYDVIFECVAAIFAVDG